jgi:serine/threonine protein phosphatase PrpC
MPVAISNQGAWQGLLLPPRSLRRETQDHEPDEQKERQGEAKNEHGRCHGRRKMISPPRAFSAG